MARKKEISKDKILEIAYKIAIKTGIESLTARNIAKAVHFSTQPIYLEFKNMTDLRNRVLDRISAELENNILQEHYTEKPLIDLDLSYINFAQEHVGLFKAMFVDGKFGSKIIANTLIRLGTERFKEEYPGEDYDDTKIRHIVVANWISATGISALLINHIAKFSKAQIINILNAQIHDAMLNDRLEVQTKKSMFAEGWFSASLKDKLA